MNSKYYVLRFLSICSIAYLVFFVMFFFYKPHYKVIFKRVQHNECPGVLSTMMFGTWKPQPPWIQALLKKPLEEFHAKFRKPRNIPGNYSRSDGLCGDVVLNGTQYGSFRALCDPTGPTPCCYKGKCVAKTVAECKCEQCYDIRQRISAELSTWVPSDPRCPVTYFNSTAACRLLMNSTIFFSGNSFLRHIFTALSMILDEDLNLSLQKKEGDETCHGMLNFLGFCQHQLNFNPYVCDGNTNITFVYQPFSRQYKNIIHGINELQHKPRTMIFMGIGIHDNYNHKLVLNYYIKTAVNILKDRRAVWPKLLWSSAHAPGLMKSPLWPKQTYKPTLYFNRWLRPHLDQLGVPVFDTFNMTDGLATSDGCHHDYAVNMLKAQLFLNYISELEQNGQW